jgi:hypothetical protein
VVGCVASRMRVSVFWLPTLPTHVLSIRYQYFKVWKWGNFCYECVGMCWKVFRVPTPSNTFHTFSNTFILINLLIHIALAPCGMCWKILGVFFTFFCFCANGENRSRLGFYPAQSLLCLTFVMVILNSDVCLAHALA